MMRTVAQLCCLSPKCATVVVVPRSYPGVVWSARLYKIGYKGKVNCVCLLRIVCGLMAGSMHIYVHTCLYMCMYSMYIFQLCGAC